MFRAHLHRTACRTAAAGLLAGCAVLSLGPVVTGYAAPVQASFHIQNLTTIMRHPAQTRTHSRAHTRAHARAQAHARVRARVGARAHVLTTANGCAITPDDLRLERYVLGLLNQHRTAVGAPPLTLDSTLSIASRTHSCDMFRHNNLQHDSSNGAAPETRVDQLRIAYTEYGENIGMTDGMEAVAGIRAMDEQMMAEPLTEEGNHHWNIVHAAYSQVGLGVIVSNGQVWLTEDFIAP